MRSMWIRGVAVVVSVSLVLVAVFLYAVRWSAARQLEVLAVAPSFTLIDQTRQSVSSDSFHGKVVVANFIYTQCPDVCSLLSSRMQDLKQRLDAEQLLGSYVQLLSFSVDPDRDTPEVLRAYAERYQANPSNWLFLSGPASEMKRVVEQGFLLGMEKTTQQTTSEHTSETYDVMHSTRFALIDRQGRIRAYYDARELDVERVMQDIRWLLR